MKNRLILVEGIPGSGKTTISNKIREYFEEKGIQAKLFNEGDAHPADLAWIACFAIAEYEQLLKEYPEYLQIIKESTTIEEDYAFVAYTKLELSRLKDKELYSYFEEHEVYDGRVPLETFKKLHLRRWKSFAESFHEEGVAIFECSYLQNHINELMATHNMDLEYIIKYMIELIKTVEDLNPKLIYLIQPDTHETISRVAKERVSTDKSRWEDWIDLVIRYVENSKYCKIHNLKGFEGAVEYFQRRKEVELAVIERLSIDKVIIDNPDYNWEDVFRRVKEALMI